MALIVAAVVAAGAAAYSASQSSKAAKEQAAGQRDAAGANLQANREYIDFLKSNQAEYAENAEALLAEGRFDVNRAYGNINKIIAGIPSIESLLPRGKKLSREDFDYRTAIKRENLAFVLGGNEAGLRNAQDRNLDLANLNDSGFTGNMRKILESNTLGLKAATVGEPLGSFANLSARNLYDFSQRGLGNFLQISDFFSREGTVDPVSPLQTTFDLYKGELGLADRKIGNEEFRANSLVNLIGSGLGVEQVKLNTGNQIATAQFQGFSDYNNRIAGQAGAESFATSKEWAGYSQAISSIASAYSGYQTNQITQQAANSQIAYNNSMTNYNDAARSTYAPTKVNNPSTSSLSNYELMAA